MGRGVGGLEEFFGPWWWDPLAGGGAQLLPALWRLPHVGRRAAVLAGEGSTVCSGCRHAFFMGSDWRHTPLSAATQS